MNINIGKTVVRKMVKDTTQPERPLIHLIESIFEEAKNVGLKDEDVEYALHTAMSSHNILKDDADEV